METNHVFHEIHTQMLAEIQRQLQPQLRPRYVARLARPTASRSEDLSPEEVALRKQRRIVIYVRSSPRLAVASIELLRIRTGRGWGRCSARGACARSAARRRRPFPAERR